MSLSLQIKKSKAQTESTKLSIKYWCGCGFVILVGGRHNRAASQGEGEQSAVVVDG